MSDVRRWVVREDGEYKIDAEQRRGYEPSFNLYTRSSFFGLFSWWSFEGWATNVEALDRYIARCKDFDAAKAERAQGVKP